MHEDFTPLDEAELEWLDEFLLNRIDDDFEPDGRDEGVINASELDGLLTALVSGPVAVMPSQWLAAIWGDFEPEWESERQFEAFMSLVTRHLNWIVATLMENQDEFEPLFYESDTNDGDSILIVDDWCEGYVRGVALEIDAWRSGGGEIETLLKPILAFTEAAGWPAHDLLTAEEADEQRDLIVPNARAIHRYWLAKRSPQSH